MHAGGHGAQERQRRADRKVERERQEAEEAKRARKAERRTKAARATEKAGLESDPAAQVRRFLLAYRCSQLGSSVVRTASSLESTSALDAADRK